MLYEKILPYLVLIIRRIINKKKNIAFIFSLGLLVLVAIIFNRFLDWHEHREGIYFNDPVFLLFNSVDVSVPTFVVLYSSIFLFIFIHRKETDKLILMATAYSFILVLRMLSLYFFPFYADPDAIKLVDPFLNTFIYPGNYVERDLFFSGHVATVVLMILFTEKKYFKWYFAIVCLVISLLVLLQKIHFSVDVIFAPFFAIFAAFGAIKTWNYFKARYNIA